jgi:oxygen-dependent protoporphyrinogen oxidase
MAAELRELPQIDGPVFAAPRDGMATIIDRLVEELSVRGVRFEWNRTVGELSGSAHDSWIVTTPAHVAAPLIGVVSPDAGELLRGISFSSVVFVTVVVDRRQVAGPLDGSGFLVPRSAGLRLTAASWMSAKWPHLGLDDRVVIRASLGHIDDPEPITWDDDSVLTAVMNDLREAMGVQGVPRAQRVIRYPRAFPQYDVGHLARMDRLTATLEADRPDIEVCGMAHGGVGIPACIRSGRTAAVRLRRRLSG